MTLTQHLLSNLRRLREEQGLHQWQLAEKAGISTVMIGRYENGYVTPNEGTVLKLREALGLSNTDEDYAGIDRNVDPRGQIRHSFRLRPDVTITLDLPPDFTQGEADRLTGFIKSLPF
jgi:transcriptional regulator with XRE-family HTH domain